MDDREFDEPVPPSLHSVYGGGPFTACIECGGELLDSKRPHAVERVVRSGEVVFEYALCAPCIMRILSDYSEESVQKIREYMAPPAEADPGALMEPGLWLMGVPRSPFRPPSGAGPRPACCRCSRPDRDGGEDHTVMGLLVGRSLFTEVSTFCSKCSEGVSDMLSRKTRDVNEDFIHRNFPGVPANLDIPVGVAGL